MALTECKVKNEDFDNMDIASLSDRPSADGMSAQMLKERFDAGAKRVFMPKFNQLVETLAGTEGADNIGAAAIEGLSGYTVQQILVAIKLLLDDKKSIESADREIAQKFDAVEAQSLVRDVTFSEGSGVFTITKYDGSVQTYDTALEKVALDVRLDGQQFVLTLVDGTEQRVDLSAFLTQTEVNSSDTITLSIESGAIVARLAVGSVMLSHLNAEVTAYIDAKELAAYQSARAAAVSEQNALNSANAAAASEQNARLYQEQACACASSAKTSETNASASERNAANSEAEAKDAAERAKAIAGGDFLECDIYDPQGKAQDVFKYADDVAGGVKNNLDNYKEVVNKELDSIKKSVSDGKTLVANAITGMGVTTAADAEFAVMAENIENIQTGIDTSDATATAAQILSGYTAYVKGEKVAGSIASQAAQTITPGTSDKTIAAGKYLSGIQTVKGDSNLKAENIKSGVSIFGVTGTAATVTNKTKSVTLTTISGYGGLTASQRSGLYAIKVQGSFGYRGSYGGGGSVSVNNEVAVVSGQTSVTAEVVTYNIANDTLSVGYYLSITAVNITVTFYYRE